MPTNRSEPIWVCDTCGTRFGPHLAAAERCEAAGVPEALPGGELLLQYKERRTHGNTSGFSLAQMFAMPGRIGSSAREYNDSAGHFLFYVLDCDPAAHVGADGRVRLPSDPSPQQLQSDWITPHEPGVLNIRETERVSFPSRPSTHSARWAVEAVGLARPGSPGDARVDLRRVRALTEPVKALLDALGARIVPAPGRAHPVNGFRYRNGNGLGALAAEAALSPAGEVDLHRAHWWLYTADPGTEAAALNARWERWRAGEQAEVPHPELKCERQVTASKLTRELKDLVAAVGFPWPAHTTADSYADQLVTRMLGYEMPTTKLLFRVPVVIPVCSGKGGVGKSYAAAAIARRFAIAGKKTVVVDCDLAGPSQHLIFGAGRVLTDPGSRRLLPSPTDLDGCYVFSPGQVFSSASAIHFDREASGQWLSFVGSCLDLDDVDVVVLDLPPGDGPVHDLIFDERAVELTAAVHVTTGHELALADAERALDRLASRYRGPAPFKRVLLENLSRAVGPATGTGELTEIRLHGDEAHTRALAERFGLDWGGSLPWAPDVSDLARCDAVADLVESLTGAAVREPAR